MQVMVRSLTQMCQEGFLLQTEICQTSTGIKTWLSIALIVKQWDVVTQACPKSDVEVKDVNNG